MEWVIYLGLCLFGPWIRGVLEPRGVRPEEIWLGIFIFLWIFRYLIKRKNEINITHIDLFFYLLLLAVIITLFINNIFINTGASLRDLNEILRVIKYWLIFKIATLLDKKKIYIILKILPILGLLTASIGMAQLIDPLGVGETIANIYSPAAIRFVSSINVLAGYMRVSGTAINPNDYGLILALILIFFWASLLATNTKKLVRSTKFWLNIISVIFIFIVIIATQSRTALVATIVAILTSNFLFYIKIKDIKKVGRITIILFGIGILLYFFVLRSDYLKSNRLLDFKNSTDSISYRRQIWEAALKETLDLSPLFGLGPQKYEEIILFEELDSQYVFFLKRWGFIGGFLFISFFPYIGWNCYNKFLKMTNAIDSYLLLAITTSIILIFVFNFTNVTYESNQFMDLWLFLAGLCFNRKML